LYGADNPIKFIDKNGEGPGEDLLMALAAAAAKYSSIINEAKAPAGRLLTGQTSLSNMPKEVTNQMGSQTKSMISTMSKVNDAAQVVKTAGTLTKEAVNDVGKVAATTGDVITGTGYIAAPFTGGASLGLVPIGESISTAGKGAQAAVCVINHDYEGAADLGVQIGTNFATNSLVNTAVNQTVKVAGNITEKEVLTQKGVLGFVGKLWEKTVDFINR